MLSHLFYKYSHFKSLLRIDFLQQAVGMTPTVHHVEDEADVDTDATGEAGIEVDVAGE